MDINNYSYAPTMLDGEPEEYVFTDECFDCPYFENCTGTKSDCESAGQNSAEGSER